MCGLLLLDCQRAALQPLDAVYNGDTPSSRRNSGRPPTGNFLNVRYGSLADITARLRHVRFTLDSGHSSVQMGCPKSANSGRLDPPVMDRLTGTRLLALQAA